MKIFTIVFFIIFFIQRFIELMIARRNEKWLIEMGGIQFRKRVNQWLTCLQYAFFLSLVCELLYKQFKFPQFNVFILSLFIIVQICRVWSIYTLGRFWNRKSIVLPKVIIIRTGMYKYIKQPQYIIVSIELLLISLLCGTYVTAIIFPISYIISFTIATPSSEDKALLEKM